MIIIELTQDYTHLSSVWKKGDRPTVSRELALQLMQEGIAIYIGEGCGCPGKRNREMVTVEFKKAYTHLSNNWKKGDRPVISRDLAFQLEKQGIVKIIDDINESVLKQVVEEEE